MSKKLIENANDCYSKDFLDKVENILCCFKKAIKSSTSLSQDQTYTNEIFGIMKNIMEQKKKLLLTAIKNFQSNQQHENPNLSSALSNLMEANVKFFHVYTINDKAFKFLINFYGEVFDKLIPVLNKNNIDDNLKQYTINLIDIIFDGILRSSNKMLYRVSCNRDLAYAIGNLFIKKYYLRNNINNKVDWRVPNLDRFISQYDCFGTYHKYIDYFPIKIELMRGKIKILQDGKVKNGNKKFDIDWTEKYDSGKFVYGYFDFDPKEFFDLENDSDEAKKFRLNIGYVISLEKDLKHIWNLCNDLFHRYKQACKNNPNLEEARDKYENIKKDRADIYSVFRELETEKQKLLKKRLVNIIRGEFKPLSLCEKIFRLSLLIITFPIYASVFILIKTLRKFFHCFFLGLECIGKLLLLGEDDCKDDWAKDCEAGNLDGLKINGKEISRRIKLYETKNWLFWRRILFPIDLVIHIIIGIFLAIKKFFTSIIKVFVTVCRVGNDIISDDASSYIFKDNDVGYNCSEIICDEDSRISVLPDTNIKIRNKFVDMTCPRTPYYDFSKKPKSAWEHFLCLIGFKSIKNAEHYDEYAHKHSATPRLKIVPFLF